MKLKPHSYQLYAKEFIESHKEAMLFLDMGLGKTVISLMAIAHLIYEEFEVSKALVVAPLRVGRDTWPAEIEKFDDVSYLKYSVMIGSPRKRAEALFRDADVYIINRENLKWLTDYLHEAGIPWPFDMVVIDELSSFKNHNSQRYKALRQVRPKIKRIIGLTGTPASNSLMDLWSEVRIIDQGERLGRFITGYRNAYFHAGDMNPYTGIVYSYEPNDGAEEQIYDKISDIAISMKSVDYLDMPECVSAAREVEMSKSEYKVYDKMKKELVASIGDEPIDASNAAVLSNKLLQMANGAVYGSEKEVVRLHDHKLEMLEDLIEEACGQSVMVAYWFQHDHDRIRTYLEAKGHHPRDLKTSEDIMDWNDGKIDVLLVSPASAGHGLNIQKGGHILIWFSMIWSLELYQQTNARLYRQGQDHVVSIQHIVTKGTIDEHVINVLRNKKETQDSLIEAVKAELGGK